MTLNDCRVVRSFTHNPLVIYFPVDNACYSEKMKVQDAESLHYSLVPYVWKSFGW